MKAMRPVQRGVGLSVNRRALLGIAAAMGAATAGVGVLSGCAPKATDGRKLAFSLETYTVPRYVHLDLPAFTAAAASDGFKTVSQQADSKVDRQLNDVINLLGQEPGAMAIAAVASGAGVNLVDHCKKDGVPVIAYNNFIPSPDLAAFVSRDNAQVGRDHVLAAERFLGGLRRNFVICSGQAGNQVAEEMTKGYYELLQPAIARGDVTVINHQFNKGWDPELARKQVEDALTRAGNNIQAVLANNDGMAGGAIEALRAQGLVGKVFVSGLDATSEACRSIVLGEQTMSTFTRYDEMGRTAGDLCARLARGETIRSEESFPIPGGGSVPWFPTTSVSITRDNLVEYVREYSPQYVDVQLIFGGIPENQLPPGAKELLLAAAKPSNGK
jgi:D-xylose transport system substrate-binding protein